MDLVHQRPSIGIDDAINGKLSDKMTIEQVLSKSFQTPSSIKPRRSTVTSVDSISLSAKSVTRSKKTNIETKSISESMKTNGKKIADSVCYLNPQLSTDFRIPE